MTLTLFMIAVLALCVGLVFGQGLWGAAVTLINVMTAALLASGMYEWFASMFDWEFGEFVSLWSLFLLLMAFFRLATDSVSKVRVRFIKPVDVAGGVFFSIWIGWLMICFITMSLHVSPLARTALLDSFMSEEHAKDENHRHMGVGPDRMWLAFLHKQSKGPFSCFSETPFDPQGDFIWSHAERRHEYHQVKKDSVAKP